MLISYALGQTGIICRVKILNSSVATGAGLTGLTFASSGLIISTIADNEASAVAYTVAGSTIETITTLGTFAAPTATKCRFKEVDATNHKGIYEIQIADARYAVNGCKSIVISISGATNAAETDAVIPLTSLNPYDAIRAGLTAIPAVASGSAGAIPTTGTGANQISLSSGLVDILQTAADKVFGASGASLTELAQAQPSATPSPAAAIMLLYMSLRNNLTSSASTKSIFNNAGTVIAKKALSDDATTYTEAKMVTGP